MKKSIYIVLKQDDDFIKLNPQNTTYSIVANFEDATIINTQEDDIYEIIGAFSIPPFGVDTYSVYISDKQQYVRTKLQKDFEESLRGVSTKYDLEFDSTHDKYKNESVQLAWMTLQAHLNKDEGGKKAEKEIKDNKKDRK